MKTAAGTGNLMAGIRACNKFNGITDEEAGPSSSSSSTLTIPYSEAAHRALIALRCASNQRPFNIVNDSLYQIEVNMLRKGTKLPRPEQVGRDTQLLYCEMSSLVCTHLLVRKFTVDIFL